MASRGGREERSGRNEEGSTEKKLYVGGLPVEIGDSDLREMFNKFGDIESAIVLKDAGGRSRGFGFIRFREQEGLDEAMRLREEVLVKGRGLEIRRAFPRDFPQEQQVTASKIFVGGCRGPVDEPSLKEYFSKYGEILSCEIIKDRVGETRGFGFVEFADWDACDKIVLEGEHRIAGRALEVRKYLSKEQFESSKRRNVEPDGKHGPPPPYMPPNGYGAPHGGRGGPYGPPDFERDRVSLLDRLFNLPDEERARELLQIDDEYFAFERERLERQLHDLSRLERERRVHIERLRAGGSGYRERSPLRHRGEFGYSERRGEYQPQPQPYETSYHTRPAPYNPYGEYESRRAFDDGGAYSREPYVPPPPPHANGHYRR